MSRIDTVSYSKCLMHTFESSKLIFFPYYLFSDKRLPASQRVEVRDKELENSRLKKWSKMLHPNSTKVWDKDMKSGKLKKRLYKGVPDAVRGEVWSRLLHIKKTKEEQIGKYEVTCFFFLLITNHLLILHT